MDDSQIFGQIVVGHAQEVGGDSRQFGIVVADHQSDGDGELGEKFRQSGFEFRCDASGSVKHVTCEHQLQRMVFVNKVGEPFQIARGVALWHRQAARAKCRGFSQMQVCNDQRGSMCAESGSFREQRERGLIGKWAHEWESGKQYCGDHTVASFPAVSTRLACHPRLWESGFLGACDPKVGSFDLCVKS